MQVIARWVRQRHIMLNLLSSNEKTLRRSVPRVLASYSRQSVARADGCDDRFMDAWKLYSTTSITLKQLYVSTKPPCSIQRERHRMAWRPI